MLNYFTALLMLLIGAIVGAVVVACSQLLGISGWVAGPIFCLLALIFSYANDRLMGLGMRHVISFLAKAEDTDLTNSEKNEIERNFYPSFDYYGFLIGAVIGTLASLLISPSVVFDFLPF